MLLLSRKHGEEIIIQLPGDQLVRVVILPSTRSREARLGIDAPRSIRVIRGELIVNSADADVSSETSSGPTGQPLLLRQSSTKTFTGD